MDKTLLKGLQVLEAIADLGSNARSIADIAARVGLTRSNAHRTVQTLIRAGFIEKHPTEGGYRGTTKLYAIGVQQMSNRDICRTAPPLMSLLSAETGETVHLAVLEHLRVLYIAKVEIPTPVQVHLLVGTSAPVHKVASGRALLAHLEPALLRQFLRTMPLSESKILEAQLSKVVRLGYATNRGEFRSGLGGVAAPIFSGSNRLEASLGISGPLERLTPSRMRELASHVTKVAAQLSRGLGCDAGLHEELV